MVQLSKAAISYRDFRSFNPFTGRQCRVENTVNLQESYTEICTSEGPLVKQKSYMNV